MKMMMMTAVAVVAFAGSLMACAGPQTTRSGEIHTVKIEKEPEPADLVVNVGDEVRWVNHRTLPVRLDLILGDASEQLSCQRGFSNFVGMKRDSAEISPNDSVAACFSKVGVVKYNIRMESALPGGRAITSGTVQVGDPTKR
ncbi:hypothetical protein DNFV4_01902 [Nitrospira tepida]|uniref:EfeO-type cupredoxin-like domain-containing protein n=2 Tax=Nitrospira tepida TaxID=2973512 RepID=A0AA86MYN9_9BACT|nr:hypothetical protein DNFV4_01902 [Nitrospira tepida]